MAPHDRRRLLLAHRDAGPVLAPGLAHDAPPRAPGAADAPPAAPDQPGAEFAPEPAGPRMPPFPNIIA